MAFTLPTFNLSCNIYPGDAIPLTVPPINPVRVVADCNLSVGRRINGGVDPFGPWLLLPPLTDIREAVTGLLGDPPDIVEVPAGSARYYQVAMVDDAGKGFPNEHRVAQLFALYPRPVPLP